MLHDPGRFQRAVLVMCLVLSTALPALAQGRPSVACVFDTTARTTLTPVSIGLAPALSAGAATMVLGHHRQVAEAIRAHFIAPGSISMPFWARVSSPVQSSVRTFSVLGNGLFSEIRFRLSAEGRLRDGIEVATATPELDAAIIAAVRRADSAGALPLPGRGEGWEGGWVGLRLVSWEPGDTAAVGLVRLVLPLVQADFPVDVVRIPAPRYPRAAQEGGIEDMIDLLYVVGENGRVVRGSARMVGGRYRTFAQAAIEAVERGEYQPARIGGCAVPQLVAQRIAFHIRPR